MYLNYLASPGCRLACLACLLSVLTVVSAARAEVVNEKLGNGTLVSAEYRSAPPESTAVLVLHGFMTTRNFNTVRSLVAELAGSGYAVLAPTLSLGVDNRRASSPCESIHTQRWQDDLAEIDFWVTWLSHRGYRSIVLFGHSIGALQLVSYANHTPPEPVKKVVAASLVNIQHYTDDAIREGEMEQARSLIGVTPRPLGQYHLIFCDDYTATPESYLSYIQWGQEQVLGLLKGSRVPVEVIMGGADRRFSSHWIGLMRKTGTPVHVIEGASHFFDSTHEFDLHDRVLRSIEEAS